MGVQMGVWGRESKRGKEELGKGGARLDPARRHYVPASSLGIRAIGLHWGLRRGVLALGRFGAGWAPTWTWTWARVLEGLGKPCLWWCCRNLRIRIKECVRTLLLGSREVRLDIGCPWAAITVSLALNAVAVNGPWI